MAVVDDHYYELENKLLEKYGSWSKVPEDDMTLIKIRVIYAGMSYQEASEKATVRKNNYDHIKKYEPKKTMLLNENAIRAHAKRNGVPLSHFGEMIGARSNYLSGLLLIGFADVEKVEQIAYWLGVDREEITAGEQISRRQPQLNFDRKKVEECMEKEGYKIEELENYLGTKTNVVRMSIVKGRGPAHVVKSLCDMADAKYWEE